MNFEVGAICLFNTGDIARITKKRTNNDGNYVITFDHKITFNTYPHIEKHRDEWEICANGIVPRTYITQIALQDRKKNVEGMILYCQQNFNPLDDKLSMFFYTKCYKIDFSDLNPIDLYSYLEEPAIDHLKKLEDFKVLEKQLIEEQKRRQAEKQKQQQDAFVQQQAVSQVVEPVTSEPAQNNQAKPVMNNDDMQKVYRLLLDFANKNVTWADMKIISEINNLEERLNQKEEEINELKKRLDLQEKATSKANSEFTNFKSEYNEHMHKVDSSLNLKNSLDQNKKNPELLLESNELKEENEDKKNEQEEEKAG